MNKNKIRNQIVSVLKHKPGLCMEGFGNIDGEFGEAIEASRTEMLDQIEPFWWCLRYLARMDRSSRCRMNSYDLKHRVEEFASMRNGGSHVYISNGIFIAAVITKRFECKRTRTEELSPNCLVNVAKKSIDQTRLETELLRREETVVKEWK